ncbi:MAG: Fibronectin type III domain protein [candidate division WS2 bacterium ADurb.Bin280]|uniref:Fibronectin type III domain protein n=1 Tax=candidate division WS2 bacterium ADurb.Bin280 TaxID=1852829 RepID=A0A1V5SCC7_9BACT|nr:MAG: Fibronectin type III domain protein [candidate division WS2 bacterium ADurb.Bin280]
MTIDNNTNYSGENTFYLLVIDNAQNQSSEKTVKFYIAPGLVRNLSALPATTAESPSTQNNFKFTWDEPENLSGEIKQYRYSINQTPSSANTTDNVVSSAQIDYGPHATQQGKNTIYVVAEGDWGGSNVNYDQYSSLDFYIQTENPNPPEGVQITDSSNRVLNQYRLTITWDEPSEGPEAEEYVVKRSTDNQTFATVGSTTSTGYLDSGLSGDDTYYYRILSKDSAGALSVENADLTVDKKPTGKYTQPPEISNTSVKVVTGATTADITWVTDRSSDSFVEYGTTEGLGLSFGQREETKEHKVSLSGLKAGTKYYYRCQSLDPGDLRDYSQDSGYSEIFEMTTTAAPTLSDVSFSSITTNSAIVSFQTNKTSIARIQYGTSTDYDKEINDSAGSGTSQHAVLLDSLQDDTTYQLKITITDEEGNQIESPGHSFSTLAMPKVESMTIESQKESADTSVKITFVTNVETLGAVEYSSADIAKKEVASSEYKKIHEFTVGGLQDQQSYTFQALARDKFGNEARSDSRVFDTPNDSRPPVITDIVIETSNVGVGREDEAQMVVSWRTDEPATSKVEYGEGISGDQYNQSTTEDGAMTNSHLVVVSALTDDNPYHLRVCSKDKGANITCSGDNTVVPGEAKKSLFTILLDTFQNTFGWLLVLIK